MYSYHLHKKLNRKKNKVICQTHDSQFDALYHTFQQKQALAHELKQAIEDWLLSIRENVEALSCLVDNLESIYDDSDGIGLRSIQSLKSLVAHLEAYPWVKYNHQPVLWYVLNNQIGHICSTQHLSTDGRLSQDL